MSELENIINELEGIVLDDRCSAELLGTRVRNQWAEIKAALRSTPPAVVVVPDGWQLAPKEPTEEMLDEALRFDANKIGLRMNHLLTGMYRAMLSASPPPQNKGERG